MAGAAIHGGRAQARKCTHTHTLKGHGSRADGNRSESASFPTTLVTLRLPPLLQPQLNCTEPCTVFLLYSHDAPAASNQHTPVALCGNRGRPKRRPCSHVRGVTQHEKHPLHTTCLPVNLHCFFLCPRRRKLVRCTDQQGVRRRRREGGRAFAVLLERIFVFLCFSPPFYSPPSEAEVNSGFQSVRKK